MTRDAKRHTPSDEFGALWPGVSGNDLNGVGESTLRQAVPGFWHPPEEQPFSKLWQISRRTTRSDAAARQFFDEAYQYPPLVDIAPAPAAQRTAREWTTAASYALANWIRSQGFVAMAYPGPKASALLLIPLAIEAGFGELGKHGSIINREFGSGLRLAGVTTDMPLDADFPDSFGADEFCMNCQACARACPPDAIGNEKQMVRDTEKWYVDFDKCIPYFVENGAYGICIAVCPWTRPQGRDKLLCTLRRRSQRPD